LDYKATGSNFKLEWIAEEAKIRRARVTSDDSHKLLISKFLFAATEALLIE
tara:strand:- start:364 stop:516 length:153 start_codon:yes stop_codon:yes gene_type:complete